MDFSCEKCGRSSYELNINLFHSWGICHDNMVLTVAVSLGCTLTAPVQCFATDPDLMEVHLRHHGLSSSKVDTKPKTAAHAKPQTTAPAVAAQTKSAAGIGQTETAASVSI